MNTPWKNVSAVSKLDRETHIWQIQLQRSPAYLEQLTRWLSQAELNRAKRIVIPYKQNYQIQSKAWLRWLLGQYIRCSADSISYTFGHLGKPYLSGRMGSIQFNATDSGGTLLIAFNQSDELGLDIELTPRNVTYHRIAEKKFTPHEQTVVTALPESHQNSAFLAIWTRKEAYGKAIGLGIRYAMNEINLCDQITDSYFKYQDQSGHNWHLQQIGGKNFIACLVSSRRCKSIKCYKLDTDSLL